jgi:hypothetical protein
VRSKSNIDRSSSTIVHQIGSYIKKVAKLSVKKIDEGIKSAKKKIGIYLFNYLLN